MFTYNFILTFFGTALLGLASGMAGSFLVVRRTALLGDVLSHAMVPGIAFALLLVSLNHVSGSGSTHFLFLFVSGVLSGAIGLFTLYGIIKCTVLKNDTALAIVLSVFFGAGASVLGIVQQQGGVYISGIESYLYGSAASLEETDVIISLVLCLVVVVFTTLFYRPFFLASFDASYAKIKGINVGLYEFLYYSMVLLVVMAGIQSVGVLLMLSLLLVPAVSMRLWTHSFLVIVWGAGLLGALSSVTGTFLSAVLEGLPSGPLIVLVSVCFFAVGFLFAPGQGIFSQYLARKSYNNKIIHEHLLRFWFEYLEKTHGKSKDHSYMKDMIMTFEEISLFERSMSASQLRKLLGSLSLSGIVDIRGEDRYSLSLKGVLEAEKIVHQHRLWELFLLEYAEIAPAMIDRSADRIEHILEPDMVRELERLLAKDETSRVIKSPHPIT